VEQARQTTQVTGDNFFPVLAGSLVFRLEQQPPVAVAKPEPRLAAQWFDELRKRAVNPSYGKPAYVFILPAAYPRASLPHPSWLS
jgi:hypothetical protein